MPFFLHFQAHFYAHSVSCHYWSFILVFWLQFFILSEGRDIVRSVLDSIKTSNMGENNLIEMIFSNKDEVNNVTNNLNFSTHRKLRDMFDKRSLTNITRKPTKNISFVLPSLRTYFNNSIKSKLIISTNSRSKRNTNCLKKPPTKGQFVTLNKNLKERAGETIKIDDAYGKEFLSCVEGAQQMGHLKGMIYLDNCCSEYFLICTGCCQACVTALYTPHYKPIPACQKIKCKESDK